MSPKSIFELRFQLDFSLVFDNLLETRITGCRVLLFNFTPHYRILTVVREISQQAKQNNAVLNGFIQNHTLETRRQIYLKHAGHGRIASVAKSVRQTWVLYISSRRTYLGAFGKHEGSSSSFVNTSFQWVISDITSLWAFTSHWQR